VIAVEPVAGCVLKTIEFCWTRVLWQLQNRLQRSLDLPADSRCRSCAFNAGCLFSPL